MKTRALPPGPKNRFPLGNFPFGGRDPLLTLTAWARQYGDIFHYRAFNFHVYFLNRPDDIEYVLVRHSRNFVKGRGLQVNRRLFGNGLLTSEGDFWLRQRRLSQPAFHRDRIASYATIMTSLTERMLAAWHGGETRDVHRDMMRLTLEIVAKALFDADVTAVVDRVGQSLEAIMRQNSRGQMLLPLLRHLPTPGNLAYRRAVGRLDRIIYQIIRERRRSGRDAGDLLSMLLRVRDEDGGRMTDRQLRDESITLMLAGHETTAIALSWTWYLLSQYPEAEQKLLAELREVLGGRSPESADLPRLVYTEKIVREAMRLYPPAYAMARIAREDCEIAGYVIPAGASVVFSQWIVHRDARFYDQPERFIPERWTAEFTRRLPKFAYFPFGGGPRICIGASFAQMEAVLLLATIAQRFKLKLLPHQAVEFLPAITLRPKNGIKVVLSPRDGARNLEPSLASPSPASRSHS
jgi:cytochrome P450